jgi:hypothetical protein
MLDNIEVANSNQRRPTYTSVRRTEPFDVPVMRAVKRTEQPSTSAVIIAVSFAMLSTFAMTQLYDSAFA